MVGGGGDLVGVETSFFYSVFTPLLTFSSSLSTQHSALRSSTADFLLFVVVVGWVAVFFYKFVAAGGFSGLRASFRLPAL